MVMQCCVPNCRANYRRGYNVNLFSFPKDVALRQQWIAAIPRDNFEPSIHTKVCQLHFEEGDIRRETGYFRTESGTTHSLALQRPRLRPGAVPRIFPSTVNSSRAGTWRLSRSEHIFPQQMPGTSGGPGGGGGGAGGGGQQSAKQSVGQQMAMLKKQIGQPGTMQQHGANKATGPPRRAVSPSPPQSPQVAPPEVCLRWNSYHSNMQATFPSLLTNEQFVDVTLACEGRSIKCHKVILSACSSYFEGLLSENPCQHPIVLMKDLRYWEVQALVDFMYRGEVNVGQDKLPSLLAAAEALQIKGLAGPASTPSSQDEDSMPATIEDFLDEQVPSPITERRMRKRRMMGSPQQQTIRPQHIQQQQQQQHHHHQQQQQQQHQQLQQQQQHQQQHQHQQRHQQLQSHSQPHPQPQPQRHVSLPSSTSSVGQSSLGRVQRQQQPQQLPARNPPNSIPSTSGYRHEQPMSEAAPPRKQRRSEPLPEVKIEPIDIDLSNDSMDEEFVEKKFTPPTEAKDDGGGAETVTEPVTEQKPDIETENFSATELSNVQEMQDYPFEPGSNSCGAKSENIAEATSDSPFGSSPGGDDVNSRDAPGED
ncbi:protein bric-a-brac 1-like isoform X7 [Schistocerca americana]|uniref:protein bric-a-brac 1-like isoform X7 n=1 Tax=Schistocerca americana TaxID=7009 RepID=UPI001F501BC4|nr:protein bric-a-brac 1-like isoform X7 [Schistocerca americana]